MGGAAVLPVPPRIAMQILLTGDPLSAARAYEIGLVNQVVPDAELVPAVQALAERIAANAPLSVIAAKRTVYLASQRRLDDASAAADEIGRRSTTARTPRKARPPSRQAPPGLDRPLMPPTLVATADLVAETAWLDEFLRPLPPPNGGSPRRPGLDHRRSGQPPGLLRRGDPV